MRIKASFDSLTSQVCLNVLFSAPFETFFLSPQSPWRSTYRNIVPHCCLQALGKLHIFICVIYLHLCFPWIFRRLQHIAVFSLDLLHWHLGCFQPHILKEDLVPAHAATHMSTYTRVVFLELVWIMQCSSDHSQHLLAIQQEYLWMCMSVSVVLCSSWLLALSWWHFNGCTAVSAAFSLPSAPLVAH